MAKEKEGWWCVFRQPAEDEKGWFISEENTKTKEVTIHRYESEAAAQAAYQQLFQSMLDRRH